MLNWHFAIYNKLCVIRMDIHYFERFKKALELGKRAEAAAALKPFIESFSSFDEKADWTKGYLASEPIGHKVRHEVYENVIFPVLLEGYRRSDPWSLRWLARTVQNLYQCDHLWMQIDRKTDYALLKELVELCPDDDGARNDLLSRQIEGFHYSVHEWPAGILYGRDGATIEECIEILEEVAYARSLDRGFLHERFLNDFEAKVHEYQQRLTRKSTLTATPPVI
jgi:hypothetical protein